MGTKRTETDSVVWAATQTNRTLHHAFDTDGRALCNPSIRAHTTSNPRAGISDFYSREHIEAQPFFKVHDRCVKKLAERQAEAAEQAAADQTPQPQWRTLKGVETPFRIHTHDGTPLRRNDTPATESMTITDMTCRGGVRYGTTADGHEVTLWGTATRYWVTSGAEQTAPAPEAPRADEVTIPAALVDYLDGTGIVTGADDADPMSKATREALAAGRSGQGNALIIRPTLDVLHVISEHAEALLTTDEATPAEREAAALWVERAGHARARIKAETVAPEITRASVDAYLARTYPALVAPEQAERHAVEHDGTAAGSTPADDATDAHAASAEPEPDNGTWRGGWITGTPSTPTGEVLFDLSPVDEQGALFA
ncbi:hypothetical protein ACWGJ2_04325 [Streptomyces sp. NPDC054796]